MNLEGILPEALATLGHVEQRGPSTAEYLLAAILEPGTTAHGILSMTGQLERLRGSYDLAIRVSARQSGDDVQALAAFVDQARAYAATLGDGMVGTEHLLLAIASSESAAALILDLTGLTERVLLQIITTRRSTLSSEPTTFDVEADVDRLAFATEASPARVEPITILRSVESADLVRVIGLGKVVDYPGLQVEFAALEVRLTGGLIYWRTQSAGVWPLAPISETVQDPTGRPFRAATMHLEGPNSARRGITWFAPRPEVGLLKVVVTFPPGDVGSGPIRAGVEIEI